MDIKAIQRFDFHCVKFQSEVVDPATRQNIGFYRILDRLQITGGGRCCKHYRLPEAGSVVRTGNDPDRALFAGVHYPLLDKQSPKALSKSIEQFQSAFSIEKRGAVSTLKLQVQTMHEIVWPP